MSLALLSCKSREAQKLKDDEFEIAVGDDPDGNKRINITRDGDSLVYYNNIYNTTEIDERVLGQHFDLRGFPDIKIYEDGELPLLQGDNMYVMNKTITYKQLFKLLTDNFKHIKNRAQINDNNVDALQINEYVMICYLYNITLLMKSMMHKGMHVSSIEIAKKELHLNEDNNAMEIKPEDKIIIYDCFYNPPAQDENKPALLEMKPPALPTPDPDPTDPPDEKPVPALPTKFPEIPIADPFQSPNPSIPVEDAIEVKTPNSTNNTASIKNNYTGDVYTPIKYQTLKPYIVF